MISITLRFEPVFKTVRSMGDTIDRQVVAGYEPVWGNQLLGHPLVPEFHLVPIKKHNHRKPRHTLIQKKWTKRFGTKLERVFYVTHHQQIIAHPASIEWLKCHASISPTGKVTI